MANPIIRQLVEYVLSQADKANHLSHGGYGLADVEYCLGGYLKRYRIEEISSLDDFDAIVMAMAALLNDINNYSMRVRASIEHSLKDHPITQDGICILRKSYQTGPTMGQEPADYKRAAFYFYKENRLEMCEEFKKRHAANWNYIVENTNPAITDNLPTYPRTTPYSDY